MVLTIDVIEGRMAGRQYLTTRSGILSTPGDLFGAIDLIIVDISIENKLFRNGVFPRGKREIVCFTLELFGQSADFLNCILTDVYKENIKFVGNSIYIF